MSNNYELYGDFSQRVLADNSAGIEPYSIDESWVRFDGFDKNQLEDHSRDLRARVRRYTRGSRDRSNANAGQGDQPHREEGAVP